MLLTKPVRLCHWPGATKSMPCSMRTVRLLVGNLSTSSTMLLLMGPPRGWSSLKGRQAGQVELAQPLLAVGLLEVGAGQGAYLYLVAVADEDGGAHLALADQRVLVGELVLGVVVLVGHLGVGDGVKDGQLGDGRAALLQLGLRHALLLLGVDDVPLAVGLGEE